MFRRIRIWTLIAALAILLAACGSAITSAPVASTAAAPAAVATAVPVATAAPAPTVVPASAAATAPAQDTAAQQSGSVRTFTIVPAQTEASYAVQEQFLNRDLPNQAIGKTNAVTGAFQFTTDGTPTGQVTNITVDLRTLTSDESKRDQRIHSQWLESDTYPFATFVSTSVTGVPDSYSEGQKISFKLTGNMTIHDVTKPVTFDVTGTLASDTVTGTATTQILMQDFGFDPPSVAGILTVKDGVTVTVNFTATEAA
jgi:polyisoprenoid-binding protein YceI